VQCVYAIATLHWYFFPLWVLYFPLWGSIFFQIIQTPPSASSGQTSLGSAPLSPVWSCLVPGLYPFNGVDSKISKYQNIKISSYHSWESIGCAMWCACSRAYSALVVQKPPTRVDSALVVPKVVPKTPRESTRLWLCQRLCQSPLASRLGLREYQNTRIRECKSARVQECKSARVQECKSARVQECKHARMQECKNARMQECKNARMQECKSARMHEAPQGCLRVPGGCPRESTLPITVRIVRFSDFPILRFSDSPIFPSLWCHLASLLVRLREFKRRLREFKRLLRDF